MKKVTFLIIAIILIIISVALTTLYFRVSYGPNVSRGTALIQQLTDQKVKVIKTFKAADSLQGYIVKEDVPNSPEAILYTNNQGNVMIAGNLLTIAHGKPANLSAQQFMQYIESKSSVKAFQTINQTHYFEQGSANAPHKLWIVADPNCIACHMAFEALLPKIEKGQVQVRWILVAFLKKSSEGKAYAILNARDPVKAMLINERLFNTKTEEGGIQPLANPSAKLQADLKKNMIFMMHNEIAETPTIFYKTRNGKTRVVAGLPAPEVFDKIINDAGDKF